MLRLVVFSVLDLEVLLLVVFSVLADQVPGVTDLDELTGLEVPGVMDLDELADLEVPGVTDLDELGCFC